VGGATFGHGRWAGLQIGSRTLTELEALQATQVRAAYERAMVEARERQAERQKRQAEEGAVLAIKQTREAGARLSTPPSPPPVGPNPPLSE